MTRSAATRLYRLILSLYPTAFRRQFGAEMMQTFNDHRDDIEANGGRTDAKFWLATVADEGANIVRQHGAALAERARLPRPTFAGIAVAALLFPPLFVALLAAGMSLAIAVPHPPMAGVAVLVGMGALVAVPALLAALVSYLLGSALVANLARRRRNRA
ncbi:MAG: hypothetical protein KIT43_16090 [Bauldia sp.]|nr:hypothetical protein [Bauldia sp.]MCW5717431.1 hypothetical protein [Bauldia sp.]